MKVIKARLFESKTIKVKVQSINANVGPFLFILYLNYYFIYNACNCAAFAAALIRIFMGVLPHPNYSSPHYCNSLLLRIMSHTDFP